MVQPANDITTPDGNGNAMKEVPGTDGGVRRGSFLSNSLTIGAECKVCVFCKTTQNLSHIKGNEITPCRAAI